MRKITCLLSLALFISLNVYSQHIDSLKLTDKEIPQGYSVSKKKNCISLQACLLYDSPDTFEMIIGKVKNKSFQSFDSKKDNGSIMYIEFEEEFKGGDFIGGLLWGGDKPTNEHPEEYYAKGNFLIIWSFKTDSPLKKKSQEKVKSLLK